MQAEKTYGNISWRVMKTVSTVFPENYFLRTSRYAVYSEKVPSLFNGFRIVQLSDLHGRSFGAGDSRLLKKIAAEVPDAVVITGDIADSHTRSYAEIFNFAKALCRKYPVYFSSGNHEINMAYKRRNELLRGLQECGVHVLDNTFEDIERSGAKIHIYGYRLPLRYYRANGCRKPRPKLTCEAMRRMIGPCSVKEYSILLAHNPLCFDTYAMWGADLTFSGHVHGGLIYLPRFGGVFSPERSFFPHYSCGVYSSDKFPERKMVVNRGLARGTRINDVPEIVLLTLHHVPKKGKE